MSSTNNPPAYDGNSSKWGAGVYYGVTALVVIILATSVISGKFFYARKQRRLYQRQIDIERATQERRGEAPGLPTYHEPGQTVPVPTLPYPDPVYRGQGYSAAPGQTIESHPEAQHDPWLPGYENAPPKYEYNTNLHPHQQQQQRSAEMQQTSTGRSVFNFRSPSPATASMNVASTTPRMSRRQTETQADEPQMQTVSLDEPRRDL